MVDRNYWTFSDSKDSDVTNLDLEDLSTTQVSEAQKTSTWKLKVFAVSVALLFVFITLASPTFMGQTPTSEYEFSIKGDAILTGDVTMTSSVEPEPELKVTLSRNGYDYLDLKDDIFKYAILENSEAVVEPYAEMNLEVILGTQDGTSFYTYSICGDLVGDTTQTTCALGKRYFGLFESLTEPVIVQCTPLTQLVLKVSEYESSTANFVRKTEVEVTCMYVRREIRSMTEEHLNATLDAMYAMWLYTDEEGQALYGTEFHSATYTLEFHHFNSVWQDADHIHEGNGFLLQHIKLSNMFEKTLQAVDPSVSLPYWDFTIDSANGTAIWDSFVMSPTVFGSMPIANDTSWGFRSDTDDIDSGAIPDGRWAYIEATMNDRYTELDFGYGYMRAPWSMNPSKYVSRYSQDWKIGTTLPTCTSHYNLLSYTSLTDFIVAMGDDPHSSVHALIGGVYGCDNFIPLLEAGYITDRTGLLTICGTWSFVIKELYRSNLLVPESGCNVTDLDCGFTCDLSDVSNFLFKVKSMVTNVPTFMTEAGWEAWKDFICEGDGKYVYPGEHLESASPHDPSFWPLHPTLERVLQVKLMSGGFENETWATIMVCQHSYCYESRVGYSDYFEDCCYGHYEKDQMLNAVTGDRFSAFGDTNGNIYLWTNPTSYNYSMTYIYDSFNWDHCLDVGVDFQDKINELAGVSYAPTTEPTLSPGNSTNETSTDDVYFNSSSSFPTPSPSLTASPSTASPSTLSPSFSTTEPTSLAPTFSPTEQPIESSVPTESPLESFIPTETPTETPTEYPTLSPESGSSDAEESPTSSWTHYPTRAPADDDDSADSTSKPTLSPDYTSKPTKSPDWTPKPTHSPDYTHWPTRSPTPSS